MRNQHDAIEFQGRSKAGCDNERSLSRSADGTSIIDAHTGALPVLGSMHP